MNRVTIAQPDITLVLDRDGLIRQASLSNDLASEVADAWLGRPWIDTVRDVGTDKVRRMLDEARSSGVSAFRQVTQRFPSGLELPIEYTTVRVGTKSNLMAVGKNLQAVAELQARLIAAQQAREQDYWKRREVETRYRLLFDASSEAVVLISAENSKILEANPAAIRALGVAPDVDLLSEMAPQERDLFQSMLTRVRDQGRAPGLILHLGSGRKSWMVRASLVASDKGAVFMLQMAPVGLTTASEPRAEPISSESLLDRLPDGFVVLDQQGIIHRANRAFLDLIQAGGEAAVLGESLGRWLWRPGADLAVLLDNLQKHGTVRLFSTTINGDLGADVEVEISAVGSSDERPRYLGLLLRDVSRRLSGGGAHGGTFATPDYIAEQIGKTSLQTLVKDTVTVIERRCIETALDKTNGNRTAAAELLGLSRQSLYAKLDRYGLEGDKLAASPEHSD